jgi:hypothetical protein
MAKKRIVRFVRNTLISVGVLLVLTIGGGVAYTWYMGEYAAPTPAAIATPVEAAPRQVITPPKPSADAPASASIQMLTSPVTPGMNASVTVKTNAEAECTISVEYNKIPSTDSGLKPKTADEFGMVSWAWTVEESVPLGTWPVSVTCSANDKSAVVKGELVVANKID